MWCVCMVCVCSSCPCSGKCRRLHPVMKCSFPWNRHHYCHDMLVFRGFCHSHHKKVRRPLQATNFAPQTCSCWFPLLAILGRCWPFSGPYIIALQTHETPPHGYHLQDFARRGWRAGCVVLTLNLCQHGALASVQSRLHQARLWHWPRVLVWRRPGSAHDFVTGVVGTWSRLRVTWRCN